MKRFAMFGVAKGETELWKETLLLSNASAADVSKVRRLATADGWHHIRVIDLDTLSADFSASVKA